MEIEGNYGKFQDVVEKLNSNWGSSFSPIMINEVLTPNGKEASFKIELPDYSVFVVTSAKHTTHSGYFQGVSGKYTVGYADNLIFTENEELIGFVGPREVFRVTNNHEDYGPSERRITVSHYHFKI